MNGGGERGDLGRPIRVVLFWGRFQSPTASKLFARLAEHPETEMVGVFCQSPGEGVAERIGDLWRRRGGLALPILVDQMARSAGGFALHPRREIERRRTKAGIDQRTELVPNLHAPEVLERIRRLEPDLGAVYGGPILKPELFQIPRFGTLSIHHGSLPEYRGKKTTFWEMYEGRETAGVAIQRIDAGLDTGDLVAQDAAPIGTKSYHRVGREVEDLGVGLYLDAILQVKRGTAAYRPQDGPRRGLYRDPPWFQILRLEWRQARKRWSGS